MKKLIVGLGNPGLKYKYSRHNLGFIVLDNIAQFYGSLKFKHSVKFDAKLALDSTKDILFLKPQTFMNNSGDSVSKIMNYYDIAPENVYVIHDDLDLPLLTLKKQFEAGSAGHNGVEDIITKLGTKKFWRIRVGIGRPENKKIDTSDWVLTNFSKTDLDAISKITENVVGMLDLTTQQ